MFCPVRQVTAPVGSQLTFGRDRQVAAPEAKSAVSCIVFYRLNCVKKMRV